jgi:hypothetical protein
MKRKILISTDEANQRTELARINSEIARMEEEAQNLREQREAEARLQEARSRRDMEQRRLQRIVGNNNVQISSANEVNWKPYEPKKKEPKVELQKVDTAKFVYFWENSSSVEEVVHRIEPFPLFHTKRGFGIASARKAAELIRTVEGIPLKELPDHPPKFGEGKANNLTLPKE